MRKIVLTLIAAVSTMLVMAQPPEGEAKPGDWYGEKVTADGAVAVAELPEMLAKDDTANVKIKTTILEVCPKKGCWLKVAVNDSTTAFVKMKDYGFFLPLAAKGKTIILDGVATVKETSVKELKHYAEDAKKPQAEIDAITKPEKEIRLMANGIVVVQ